MKKSEKNSSEDRSFFDDLKIFETIFLSKPEFSDLRVNIFVDPKHHRYPGYRWFVGRNSFVIEKLGGTVEARLYNHHHHTMATFPYNLCNQRIKTISCNSATQVFFNQILI